MSMKELQIGAGDIDTNPVQEREELIPANHPLKLHDANVNSFAIVEGVSGENLAFKALGNRVIILEDKFRSGMECRACEGSGVGKPQECGKCAGKGVDRFNNVCSECLGAKSSESKCSACGGKGVKEGGIILPKNSEAPPTSGKIVSIGPLVKNLQVGNRVLYANYTGTKINFKQKGVMRVMHEDEVQLLVFGVAEIEESLA